MHHYLLTYELNILYLLSMTRENSKFLAIYCSSRKNPEVPSSVKQFLWIYYLWVEVRITEDDDEIHILAQDHLVNLQENQRDV